MDHRTSINVCSPALGCHVAHLPPAAADSSHPAKGIHVNQCSHAICMQPPHPPKDDPAGNHSLDYHVSRRSHAHCKPPSCPLNSKGYFTDDHISSCSHAHRTPTSNAPPDHPRKHDSEDATWRTRRTGYTAAAGQTLPAADPYRPHADGGNRGHSRP